MVTKAEVKKALEYQWRGQQWKIYLVVWIAVAVISPVFALGVGSVETQMIAALITAGIFGAIFLPFILYPMCRQWEMLHGRGRYQRYRVKLSNPYTSWHYRGAVYYRVVFQAEDGETVVRDTKPLFSSAMFAICPLEDYNNKTVNIFYDPQKDKVILEG